MLARVHSCAVIGLEGVVVAVEVDTADGLPSVTIVGLPDAAVQESRERVQAAVKNAGLFFPRRRLVVNLAPAAVRKEGPAYDLPIALGALIASGQLMPDSVEGAMVVGELSLDGVCATCRRAADGHKWRFRRVSSVSTARGRRRRSSPGARAEVYPAVLAAHAHHPGDPLAASAHLTLENLPITAQTDRRGQGRHVKRALEVYGWQLQPDDGRATRIGKTLLMPSRHLAPDRRAPDATHHSVADQLPPDVR
jgi:magnesium chelatase family protein